MLGYNRMTGYNKARYNAEGSEIQKADTITVADDTITRQLQRALADLFTFADTIAKQQNKSVSDSMKLDVWLRVNRDDAGKWGNE